MDFFDKLGGFAKNAGDKTSEFFKTATDRADDMIETGKLKTKLTAAKKASDEAKLRLGDYCYHKPHDSSLMDAAEKDLYDAIEEAEREIAALNASIEAIRVENESAEKAPVAETPAAPQFCAGCGAPLAPETAFCGQCGSKVKRD